MTNQSENDRIAEATYPQVIDRLRAQLAFLVTCDRLKNVVRTTHLHDGSRAENSAEHSWHLALTALTLAEYAPPDVNLPRVVELLVIHDLVEIYAGDLYFGATDEQHDEQALQEQAAAQALFGLLPVDRRGHFQKLWEEFEAKQTSEARFAKALDALQPMLLTWGEGGKGCLEREPDLTARRLLMLKEKHLQAFPALWRWAQQMIDEATRLGTIAAG
ncbi:HD domain-containing protein [Deinococcus hopiensis]|uniref:Putative hydrolases of HD superfamily n=1 Tax=Deinococcus hopiensis KR-140 TaxID=695939 RepID=A0A1W1UXQ8_9DEIO|nr:HD domain-containing protein [Deinococcus hopiensis]SMB85829.1 putative hydrolases of HD superfamily [Deinococcus hopiensis KR-140]